MVDGFLRFGDASFPRAEGVSSARSRRVPNKPPLSLLSVLMVSFDEQMFIF